MSEEYNPEAKVLEQVERVEVELKEVLHKRNAAEEQAEREVLQRQVDELENRLKILRAQLKDKLA